MAVSSEELYAFRAKKPTKEQVTQIVQDVNNFPWLNGEAYVDNKGYRALAIHARWAVDDMADVIEWLREGGFYEQSDRLRVIEQRLRERVLYVMPDPPPKPSKAKK